MFIFYSPQILIWFLFSLEEDILRGILVCSLSQLSIEYNRRSTDPAFNNQDACITKHILSAMTTMFIGILYNIYAIMTENDGTSFPLVCLIDICLMTIRLLY
jgi:hypothetical protein